MFEGILYRFNWVILKIFSKLLLRIDVVFHGSMPKGAKIIVINHPTTSDPFILHSLLYDRTSILIKGSIFTLPIFGKYMEKCGHIPVAKNNGQAAFDASLKRLNKGISILIFIEGEMSPEEGGYFQPRTGAVRLACLSGRPIIPIGIAVKKSNIKYFNPVINGTNDSVRGYFYGPYAVTIGKPLSLVGNVEDRDWIKTMSQRLMEQVINLAEESTKRIYS